MSRLRNFTLVCAIGAAAFALLGAIMLLMPGLIGESALIQKLPSTDLVGAVSQAQDLESLRRLCLPLAQSQEQALAATQSAADALRWSADTLALALLGGGVLVCGAFAYVHLLLRQRHDQSAL
jgi:hypothetical protein